MKIGIDGRLFDQTGVGRYIKNLFYWLNKVDRKNQYYLFQPKIHWHSIAEQIYFPFWLIFQKIDLIHFPYFSFPVFYPKKFIITIHDLIPWHLKSGRATTLPGWLYEIKYFFYKLILWVGVKRAVKIITVSQTTKREIIKNLKIPSGKIIVIYEGVEDKFRVAVSKTQINIKKINFKKYFLYVGNAYPHKNLPNLIKAFKNITKNNNIRLVLTGPNDYFYQKLIANNKNEFSKNLIFFGPASDEELIFLYQQALALVNPSLMEGFGLPGLEAMTTGCPVICSDIEAFREVYGNIPLYFNPQDSSDIQKKIEIIIKMTTAERKKMIAAGKKQSRKYSWEECAKKTKEVYESCFGL